MRKADEAEAVRKWAEEELERVRNETEAPAASPEPWVTFEEMDRCPSSPPPPPPPPPPFTPPPPPPPPPSPPPPPPTAPPPPPPSSDSHPPPPPLSMTASSPSSLSYSSTLPAGTECVVCLIRASSMVLLPCGHVCSCQNCAQLFVSQDCPLCRTTVAQVVRIYLP